MMKGPLSDLLLVVNGAESSIEAAKYAIALAKTNGARVSAIYVVDTATIRQLALSRIFVPDESDEYEKSLEETGQRYLAYVEELASEKRCKITTLLRKGAIAGEVIKAVEDVGANGIVIGGGEQNTINRSSVNESAREIVRNASCPVLIVRGREADRLWRTL